MKRKRVVILALALAALTALLATGPAAASQELAKVGGCLSCHSVDKKKMGPSFKEVAAKYKGKADAEATLVKTLSDTRAHPEHKSKGDDLTAVVKWMLAQ